MPALFQIPRLLKGMRTVLGEDVVPVPSRALSLVGGMWDMMVADFLCACESARLMPSVPAGGPV